MAAKKNYEFEDAHILFTPNFSGRPGRFDRGKGPFKRFFNLRLTEEEAAMLAKDGFTVKSYIPKDGTEADEKLFLEVRVSYLHKEKAPRICYVDGDRILSEVDEDSVGELDEDEICHIDLVVTGSNWQDEDGNWRTTAYLKEMYVEVARSRFRDKYHAVAMEEPDVEVEADPEEE